MNARADLFEAAQQIRVVAERKMRIQSVDDVELGERLIRTLTKLVPRLFQRHRVRLGHTRLEAREGTEETARLADIRRLEAEVVVEIRSRAVTLLALTVGEPADGKQVRRVEELHAVFEREAFAGPQLVVDLGESGRFQARFHLEKEPGLIFEPN